MLTSEELAEARYLYTVDEASRRYQAALYELMAPAKACYRRDMETARAEFERAMADG